MFTDEWWVYYGFGQVYSADTILKGIGPAWSLCTELLFYAALPFLAVALGRAWRGGRRRGVRAELAVLAALGLASFGFRAAIELGDGASYLTQTILGTFDGFALGMALAVASVALADGREQPAAVRLVTARPGVAWAVALACFAAAAAIAGPDPAFLLGTGTPAGEALAVRVLGLSDRRRAARARHVRRRRGRRAPAPARPPRCSRGSARSPTASTCGTTRSSSG